MSEFQVPPPSDDAAGELADWAECALLLEQKAFLSRANLRDRLREIMLVEDDDLDSSMDMLLREVERRRTAAPEFYPFKRDLVRQGVVLDEDIDHSPYEFLLWLEKSPAFRQERRQGQTESRFNGLVKQAIRRYLGEGTKVREIAAASRGNRPSFRAVLDDLADDMNLYRTSENPRAHRKDGGVDLVAWRPFSDGRPSFLVLLCQCTVQVDWTPKASDISVDLWKTWIAFVRTPLTALAVPFAVPHEFEKWIEVRSRVDIIFDRVRLCELLRAEECDGIDNLRTWCDKERTLLYL
jgi:hypothetical protein